MVSAQYSGICYFTGNISNVYEVPVLSEHVEDYIWLVEHVNSMPVARIGLIFAKRSPFADEGSSINFVDMVTSNYILGSNMCMIGNLAAHILIL